MTRILQVVRSQPWLPPLLVLAVLAGIIEALRPGLFSIGQLDIKSSAALTLILVGIGETLVVLRGGLDLSVGGVMSLATAIVATRGDLSLWQLLPWLGVVLAMGAAVGTLNGLLISLLRLQPFLVTLATWSMVEGLALTILPSESASVPRAWSAMGYAKVAGVPLAIVVLAALIVWWIWFRRTRIFARLRAAGSNERSAFLNRVNLTHANVLAYGLSGVFAAAAGFYFAIQTGSGSPTLGAQFVLPAIAAVVIGGTSLAGGRGGLTGTMIGAFILTLVGDVVFLLKLASYWQPIASGLILLLVVVISAFSEPREGGAS